MPGKYVAALALAATLAVGMAGYAIAQDAPKPAAPVAEAEERAVDYVAVVPDAT